MPDLRDELDAFLESVPGKCYAKTTKIFAPTCGGTCQGAVDDLVSAVNRIFKGSTIYDAEGSWNEGNRIITEPVKVIEIAHAPICPDTAQELAEAITEYGRKAGQQEIAIMDGNFYMMKTSALFEGLLERTGRPMQELFASPRIRARRRR